jgi:hypothetical protein
MTRTEAKTASVHSVEKFGRSAQLRWNAAGAMADASDPKDFHAAPAAEILPQRLGAVPLTTARKRDENRSRSWRGTFGPRLLSPTTGFLCFGECHLFSAMHCHDDGGNAQSRAAEMCRQVSPRTPVPGAF